MANGTTVFAWGSTPSGFASVAGLTFAPVGTAINPVAGYGNNLENQCEITMRAAGTVANMSAPLTTSYAHTLTYTLYKNAVASTLSVSIPSGSTGIFTDNTHSIAVVSGDTLSMALSGAASGVGPGYGVLTAGFTATSGTVTILSVNGADGFSDTTRYYMPIMGGFSLSTTDAAVSTRLPINGTLSNLALQVYNNARGGTTTAQTRLSGANGLQALSIPGSGTGYFEDTTHTDAYTAQQDVDVTIKASTAIDTNVFNFSLLAMHFTSTTNRETLIGTDLPASMTIASGSTITMPVAGGLSRPTAVSGLGTLDNAYMPIQGIASSFQMNVFIGSTTASTATLYHNNIAAAQAVSIGANATGWFQDATHTDVFTTNDSFRVGITTGSGTSLVVGMSMMKLFQTVSVSGNVSGVVASGSVGTLTPNALSTLTGVVASGLAQGITPSGAGTISGVAATGVVGTETPSTSFNIVGVSASGLAQNVSLSLSKTITGVSATGQVGSLTPSVADTITGVVASGFAGTVALKDTVAVTGVAAAGAVGSVTPSEQLTLSGVSATGQVGVVQLSETATISGVSASGLAGTTTDSVVLSLQGVQATGIVGSIALSWGANAIGVSGTGAVGTLGTLAFASASGVGLAGSVVSRVDALGLSVSANGAVGLLNFIDTAVLTGVSANGIANDVTFSAGAAPLGVSAAGVASAFTPDPAANPLGVFGIGLAAPTNTSFVNMPSVFGVGLAGDVTFGLAPALVGAQALGIVGSVLGSAALSPLGVTATGFIGDIGFEADAFLFGVSATGYAGDLHGGHGPAIMGVTGLGYAASLAAEADTGFIEGVVGFGQVGKFTHTFLLRNRVYLSGSINIYR